MIDGFTRMDCGECGIMFYVPNSFHRERKETGKGWNCPNGHSRIFSESDVDRLRRERNLLKQQIAHRDDSIADLWGRVDTEERRTAAYKGQVTKMKKRAKAGVCSCCNRHFVNLERHMASKHPDMDPEAELVVIEGGKR